jgi:hypothetical protein
MAQGPGKYDDMATYVREQTNARGVVVIVFGGDRGMGFSVQGDEMLTRALPTLLENMAKGIREDAQR